MKITLEMDTNDLFELERILYLHFIYLEKELRGIDYRISKEGVEFFNTPVFKGSNQTYGEKRQELAEQIKETKMIWKRVRGE